MKKIKLSLFLSTYFLCTLNPMYASTTTLQENSKKNVGIERGWHYQEGNEADKSEKEKSVQELLAEMLKVQKEQLKVQKNIEKMLQTQFDPQPPKFLNNDGKECVANESGDCYKYPMRPEANWSPALAKMLQNPTIENAIKYKQVEDAHLNHVEDIGYSMKYAALNNKQKTKTLIDSTSMLSGKYNIYLTRAMSDVLKKHSKSMKVYILMSDDGREYLNVRKGILKSLTYLKNANIFPEIVFKDQKAYSTFKSVLNRYDSVILEEFEAQEPTIIISEKTHSAINPIAYPTYIVKYKDEKDNKSFTQIFGAGNSQNSDFIRNLYEILVVQKVVDRSKINNEVLQQYEFDEFKNKYMNEVKK